MSPIGAIAGDEQPRRGIDADGHDSPTCGDDGTHALAAAARVYWQTHEGNAAARRLYDRVAEGSGFIVNRRAP